MLPLSPTPPHPGIHHPDCCHHRLVLSVLELYLNGVTQFVLFCVWLFSLNIRLGRSIHVTVYSRSLFFVAGIGFHCVMVTQSIHPFYCEKNVQSPLFFTLKLCCHPQIPAHKRIDRTFSKELEIEEGCETHKHNYRGRCFPNRRAALRWPGGQWFGHSYRFSCSIALYKALFPAASRSPIGWPGACPHAVSEETNAKGSDSNTTG